MSNVLCIFCNQTREKAKEHIWPRWLQQKMMGSTKWPYSGTHRSSYFFPISVRNHSGENLVLGEVCQICNNGWMADLENHFRPVLEKIENVQDGLRLVSKSERNIIALWAFKTSLVINAGTNYRKIVPEEHYYHICKFRAIAKDVKVDSCYIKEFQKLGWIQSQLTFALGPTKEMEKNPLILKDNNFNVTMQIGNLGLRVSWFRDSKDKGYVLSSIDTENVLRLWPYERNGQQNERNSFTDIDSFQLSLLLKKDGI
jgi:hypothetical protein